MVDKIHSMYLQSILWSANPDTGYIISDKHNYITENMHAYILSNIHFDAYLYTHIQLNNIRLSWPKNY